MPASPIASRLPAEVTAAPANPGRRQRRYSWCLVGGALLPLAAAITTVMTILDPSAWLSPADGWQGLAPVGILFSTTLLLVAAPLCGLAVAVHARQLAPFGGAWAATRDTCGVLALGAIAWTAAAIGSTAAITAMAGDPLSPPLVAAHIVQGAAALALALVGALAGAWFREPLDAAAFSLTLALVASLGILGAGTLVELLPERLVEWAVAGSPLLAVSSAAHIDVMRTDLVYQISPLAHTQTPSFSWPAAAGAYVVIAAGCAAGLARVYSRIASEPLFHQQ